MPEGMLCPDNFVFAGLVDHVMFTLCAIRSGLNYAWLSQDFPVFISIQILMICEPAIIFGLEVSKRTDQGTGFGRARCRST